MEKYTQLIKCIAKVISDLDRDNYLLSCELERTKENLKRAESKIAAVEEYVDGMMCGVAAKEDHDA